MATAIPLHCISDSLALKGQNNFLYSPVPGLCYDRTLKLYILFFFSESDSEISEELWHNSKASAGLYGT